MVRCRVRRKMAKEQRHDRAIDESSKPKMIDSTETPSWVEELLDRGEVWKESILIVLFYLYFIWHVFSFCFDPNRTSRGSQIDAFSHVLVRQCDTLHREMCGG